MSNEIKNVPDNRDREENQTTKPDVNEVSGSSDCSFSFPGGPMQDFVGKTISDIRWHSSWADIYFDDGTKGMIEIYTDSRKFLGSNKRWREFIKDHCLAVSGGLMPTPYGRRVSCSDVEKCSLVQQEQPLQ